jgi:hypothetical protein
MFTCPFTVNINCDNPFGPLCGLRSETVRYLSRGERWQDAVRFRLDLKHFVVLWGVLRGQPSFFLPVFVVDGRSGVCLCFLGLFGD